jgi:hypothetical protein
MERVRTTLKKVSPDVPVFDAQMSQFKVYSKTLWQAVPVHNVGGRGTRGKSLARNELGVIADELHRKIAALRGGS